MLDDLGHIPGTNRTVEADLGRYLRGVLADELESEDVWPKNRARGEPIFGTNYKTRKNYLTNLRKVTAT